MCIPQRVMQTITYNKHDCVKEAPPFLAVYVCNADWSNSGFPCPKSDMLIPFSSLLTIRIPFIIRGFYSEYARRWYSVSVTNFLSCTFNHSHPPVA